jgi:hypothetical protein
MATTVASNIERARALMHRSRREHFAVGAFNVDNRETLLAILRGAQAKESVTTPSGWSISVDGAWKN